MTTRRVNERITIIDVAKRAKVSAGTVSNALTGKRPVADMTRQRILQAIEDLGYQPNLLARGLVNRTSGILAVVTTGLEYYGPSRTLVGIEEQANAFGYSILLDLLHSPVDDDVDKVLDDLASRRVDGIVWAVHEIGNNRAWLQEERLRRLPPIVFLTMEPRPGVSVLSTENRAGARLAVQHLLDQGRRKVGLVTGPLDWWEARERKQGWKNALEAAGMPSTLDLVAHGNWSAASGEEGLYRMLDERPDTDAIFASNDQMALGVLRAAHLLGRRVPDDLAIVGYDNMPESAFFWPPLTSVRQHLRQLGQVAVQELQHAIDAQQSEQRSESPVARVLAPDLVVRESSVASAMTRTSR